MENKKYLVANMKMNLSYVEIMEYLKKIKTNDKTSKVIFCPSAIYLPYFIEYGLKVGVQNTSQYEKGAYTGELSPQQVAGMKEICKNLNHPEVLIYTILGHSERRTIFHETNELVSSKVKQALDAGLSVILCVGETLEERADGKTEAVIDLEISTVLSQITKEQSQNMMIAYEPIWAIGTGKIPTNEEIYETLNAIENMLKPFECGDIPLLYGGSVNAENIASLNGISNVSGFLVGGACLKAEQFLNMIEVVL